MAIFLKGDIQKAYEPVTNERLRALLDENEPKVARYLARMWGRQAQDIGYPEIRQAIVTGVIDEKLLDQWRQDYSFFVTESLMPEWLIFMNEAVGRLNERYPSFSFDPTTKGIANYVTQHGAELVTNSTAQQIEAIRNMVQRSAVVQDITVDELARMIRPTIGLYKGQATANLNYYRAVRNTLQEMNTGMRPETAQKRAKAAATKYAERQHRYRAMMIARTELAFAHNAGAYYGLKQAQDEGLIGAVKKQWITADDDRVCKHCRAMDLLEVDVDEKFTTGRLLPPLHPHCRCVVNYNEL